MERIVESGANPFGENPDNHISGDYNQQVGSRSRPKVGAPGIDRRTELTTTRPNATSDEAIRARHSFGLSARLAEINQATRVTTPSPLTRLTSDENRCQ